MAADFDWQYDRDVYYCLCIHPLVFKRHIKESFNFKILGIKDIEQEKLDFTQTLHLCYLILIFGDILQTQKASKYLLSTFKTLKKRTVAISFDSTHLE